MPLLKDICSRLLPIKGKVTAPFFDEQSNLLLLEVAHLDIIPRPELVNYYGPLYTRQLLHHARTGNTDFELFMELHRRANSCYNRSRVPEDWDRAAGTKEKQESNERILRRYERRWGVERRNCVTWMGGSAGCGR